MHSTKIDKSFYIGDIGHIGYIDHIGYIGHIGHIGHIDIGNMVGY